MRFVLACILLLASVGVVAETPRRVVTLDIIYEDTFRNYAEQRGEDPKELALKIYWSRIVPAYWQAFRIFVKVRDVRYASINASTGSASSHLAAFREHLWYVDGYMSNPERAPGLSSMLTNRLYDGGVRGVAYMSTVCNPYLSYSISSIRPNDMSGPPTYPHELGHNLGADHDPVSGKIMFGAVYTGTLYNGFSALSVQDIEDRLATLPTGNQTDCVVEF
jgi:hypothetical protein